MLCKIVPEIEFFLHNAQLAKGVQMGGFRIGPRPLRVIHILRRGTLAA
jgi:hypothetical protein